MSHITRQLAYLHYKVRLDKGVCHELSCTERVMYITFDSGHMMPFRVFAAKLYDFGLITRAIWKKCCITDDPMFATKILKHHEAYFLLLNPIFEL